MNVVGTTAMHQNRVLTIRAVALLAPSLAQGGWQEQGQLLLGITVEPWAQIALWLGCRKWLSPLILADEWFGFTLFF